MALTTAQIQNAYVAFFNRPADVAGLTYWSTYAGSTADLLNTFAQSAEYKSLYSGMNNTQMVNAVYQNLFAHAPDVAGLTYWVTQLDQGKLAIGNIADAINKGAQGTDSTIIANKVTAATAFTNALDTTAEIVAYAGVNSTGLTAVKNWLAAVTSDSATLTSATSTAGLNAITATVQNNVAATGSTFTLTTGADSITGSSGNDTINGVIQQTTTPTDSGTLNSSDSINGGAGTDTLNIRVTSVGGAAQTVVPTLTDVETVSVSNVDGTANMAAINLVSSSGVTTVQFKDNTTGGQTAFVNASTTAAIVLDNADSATQNVNLGSAGGRTGTADAFSVSIKNGSGSSTANAGLQLVTSAAGFVTADTSFETANVTLEGAANFVQFGTSLAGMTTLNVSGSGTNTTGYALTLTEAANFASLKTINLSGVTAGGVSVATTGAADLAYTGSAGSDRLVITGGTGNLTSSDVINFGTGSADVLAFGTDTAVASYAAGKLALINAVTTADQLEFTAAAMTTLKANDFTVVNDFKFSGGNTTTATTLALTGVETADSFTVSADMAAAAAATQTGATAGTVGVDAITFTGAAVAQTATLKLTGGVDIAGMAGQAISTDTTTRAAGAGGDAIDFGGNITKLVINSTGTTANTITGGAGGTAVVTNGTGGAGGVAIANTTAVQTVEITGSTALTIAGTAAATGTAANGAASGGFSGAVNVNASTFTAKLTLTGSTGNDVITAGSGGTVFRGFGGTDSFTAGSGVDQYNLLTAADSNTAASCSSITGFAAGTDKIVVGTAPVAVKQGALYTAAGTGTLATDLASAITAGGAIGTNGAAVVTITGTGAGTYLVYDANGSGGYADAGADIVVKLVGLVGTLSTGDFATSIV